jgi:hypothetical protein
MVQEDTGTMRVTDSALHRTAQRLYTTPAAGFVTGTGCNLSVGVLDSASQCLL